MCTSKSRPRTCADNPRLVKAPPLARAGGPSRLRDTARSRLSLAGVASRGAEFRGGKLRLDRLDPDQRTVDRSQFEVDRRRRTVYDLGWVLPASRRSRPPPSHSGGQRVRNRLRRNSSAAVDRRQPEPAGTVGRRSRPVRRHGQRDGRRNDHVVGSAAHLRNASGPAGGLA